MINKISRREMIGCAASVPLLYSASAAVAAKLDVMPSRLFFTPAKLAEARRLKNSGVLANAWANLRAEADRARVRAPAFFTTTTDTTRWWQRYAGWSMANLAAAYLLGGDPADRDMAIRLATMAADYTPWGGSNALFDGDLNASDLLFGISMVVDWLSPFMSAAVRAKLISAMCTHGAHLSSYATGIGGPAAWWSEKWMQNHLWDNITGLLATGLALQNDAPAIASKFIGAAMDHGAHAFAALMPDGGTQESPGYWEFTADSVLRFQYLASEVIGQHMKGPWLYQAANFRMAMTLPLAACTPAQCLINQADGDTAPWFGPEYQLRRLASITRDGVAQSAAATLEAAGLTKPTAPWLNFVWFDPTVPASTPPRPTLEHFTDMDMIAARSDHSGYEALVVMRCGAPFGRQAQAARYTYDIGLGHTHPDVNHITLFAASHFLLRDDGYSTQKATTQHNTLLVNGIGQKFEGAPWAAESHYPLPDPQPTLQAIEHTTLLDYWIGFGAAAYPTTTGLRRFNRHVVFIRPNVLVVVDDLLAAASVQYKLLWHFGGSVGAGFMPQQFMAVFGQTMLLTTFVLPSGATSAVGVRDFMVDASPAPVPVPELAVTINAQAAQCGTLFDWGIGGMPGRASLTQSGANWLIGTAGQKVILNVAEHTISVV